MKFGHLVNGKLVSAKMPIVKDNKTYYTNDPELLFTLGEKEVVATSMPPLSDDGLYKSVWKETDKQIIQEWEFEAYPESILKDKYKALTVKYIREKYSQNQEFAILREYMVDQEANKAAFEEYSNYVEACKVRAHQEIYNTEVST
jgi:hypothetical protein